MPAGTAALKPKCHGSCYIKLGPGSHRSTAGLRQAICSENRSRRKKVGFWCSDGGDTGSVMQIGKKCHHYRDDVDSGIAAIEDNPGYKFSDEIAADFASNARSTPYDTSYSINLWVK